VTTIAADVESRARQSLGQGHGAIHAMVVGLLDARGAAYLRFPRGG